MVGYICLTPGSVSYLLCRLMILKGRTVAIHLPT